MKKMNNKGFSLVELIVVIAIMAVLVGVLAPTLIKNVEKSRESTDLQNLDTIRGAVVTTLSDETVAAKIPTSSTTYVLDTTNVALSLTSGTGSDAFTNAFNAKIKDSLSKVGKLKSGNAVAAGNIFVTIDHNSAVTVYIASSASGAVATCKITKSDSNEAMEYRSK